MCASLIGPCDQAIRPSLIFMNIALCSVSPIIYVYSPRRQNTVIAKEIDGDRKTTI